MYFVQKKWDVSMNEGESEAVRYQHVTYNKKAFNNKVELDQKITDTVCLLISLLRRLDAEGAMLSAVQSTAYCYIE